MKFIHFAAVCSSACIHFSQFWHFHLFFYFGTQPWKVLRREMIRKYCIRIIILYWSTNLENKKNTNKNHQISNCKESLIFLNSCKTNQWWRLIFISAFISWSSRIFIIWFYPATGAPRVLNLLKYSIVCVWTEKVVVKINAGYQSAYVDSCSNFKFVWCTNSSFWMFNHIYNQ